MAMRSGQSLCRGRPVGASLRKFTLNFAVLRDTYWLPMRGPSCPPILVVVPICGG